MRIGVAALAAVVLSGCGDAFTSRVDTVARVEGYELGVEPAAMMIATGKGLPLRRDVVEGIATLWVDYTLFAHRLLTGDSLLDSGLVAAAMWADIQQDIANRYHDKLIGERANLDSAGLDSAYAAGNHRLIKHVLFRVNPDASPEVRAAKRRAAEVTQRRLLNGALLWSQAVEVTEDRSDAEGSVGVIERGDFNERFESAAFALAPGEISSVTETQFGFHVLYRPRLADVREEYRNRLRTKLEERFDEEYLSALPERWHVRVRRGIAPAARQVGLDPLRAKRSGQVIGSYRGGEFRVSDLARWLEAMPPQVRQQLPAASDSQITEMVRSLIRNEALLREAREAGVTVTSELMAEVRENLRRKLALMAGLLDLPFDSLPMLRALPLEQREAMVRDRVLKYLEALTQERRRLQTLPPALADALRAEARWAVVPAGVERVLEKSREVRLALDTLPGQRGGPELTPAPMLPAPPAMADSGAS